MRFEIESLKDGWADIRFDFHTDNPERLCPVRSEDETTPKPDTKDNSWHYGISNCHYDDNPRFFFEFLKALNEISSIESGSRYVTFHNDEDYEEDSKGAFSVRKRNHDLYEVDYSRKTLPIH